jgi:Tfp pilus assembly protein PilX
MKLLLKVLLFRRARDEGVVIPVVIMLGLIMTLVGIISIYQSGDEKDLAIAKRSSSRALAAAEAGVAYYREFIDKYKTIAVYNACTTTAWNASGACNDTAAIRSWKNAATQIPNINASCPTNASTAVAAAATRTWQTLGTGVTQGQYRLVDYTYTNGTFNAGTSKYDPQPVGTLIVEGRVNQNNTNLTNEVGASVSRISVDVPIQPGIPNPDGNTSVDTKLNGFDPALWITRNDPNGVSDVGNLKVNGNIILTKTDCTFNTSATLPSATDVYTNTKQTIITTTLAPTTYPMPGGASVNDISLADLKNEALPIAGDDETSVNGDTVYYYQLTAGDDLDLDDGDIIDIRSGRKVVLYVNGDIDITGNVKVNYDYKGVAFKNNSSHLEIYVIKPNADINFGGTGDIQIQALIHAPDATVNVISGDPKITVIGAMWVKDWNVTTNLTTPFYINAYNNGAAYVSKEEDLYLNYTYVYDYLRDLNAEIADPQIDTPSRWETKEVN